MTSRIITLAGFIIVIPLIFLIDGDKHVEPKEDNGILHTRGGGDIIIPVEKKIVHLSPQQIDSLYKDTAKKLCYIKAKIEADE